MKSYKVGEYHNTSLEVNESKEGETIETKIMRVVENKEPIKDGAPIIYTDRNDGIISAYNIKTDRFEIACEAMDVVSRTNIAKRMGKPLEKEVIQLQPDGGTEPTRGTNENQ